MKKYIFTAVVVISILSMLTMAVAPAPRSAVLHQVKFTFGKGVVLIFRLEGKFDGADLKNAYITVNHVNYPLHCGNIDGDYVRCQAPGRINEFNGKSAFGAFAGFPFSFVIPVKTTHRTLD